MSKLSVASFSISLDGYGAGPSQSREEPLGVGGESLHDWMVETKAFAELVGGGGGSGGTGVTRHFSGSSA